MLFICLSSYFILLWGFFIAQDIFHFFPGALLRIFFILLPGVFSFHCLGYFHSLAQEIFHSLAGAFSFPCLGYFYFFAWDIFIHLPRIYFILLPRIFSFLCLGYFHSPAQDIFHFLAGAFSFPCLGYFHFFAWDIFILLPRIYFILLPGIFSFSCLGYFIPLPVHILATLSNLILAALSNLQYLLNNLAPPPAPPWVPKHPRWV